MAQLVAHLHGMQGVRGSSPLSSTHDKGTGLIPGPFVCRVAAGIREERPRAATAPSAPPKVGIPAPNRRLYVPGQYPGSTDADCMCSGGAGGAPRALVRPWTSTMQRRMGGSMRFARDDQTTSRRVLASAVAATLLVPGAHRDRGRVHGPGGHVTVTGVDVSRWDHSNGDPIDWRQGQVVRPLVRHRQSHRGHLDHEPLLRRRLQAGQVGGLVVGAYHFARPQLPISQRADAGPLLRLDVQKRRFVPLHHDPSRRCSTSR